MLITQIITFPVTCLLHDRLHYITPHVTWPYMFSENITCNLHESLHDILYVTLHVTLHDITCHITWIYHTLHGFT